jgi:hypothetical protein
VIVGRFAAYTKEEQKASQQDLDSEPTSAAIFNLLSLPFFTQTDERGPRIGSDKERPRKLKKIKRAFRPLIDQDIGENSTTRRLKYEGGELVLEDEEMKVVKAVWEEFRATLPTSMADLCVAVDDWLEDVADFTAKEWEAELAKRAEPTPQ